MTHSMNATLACRECMDHRGCHIAYRLMHDRLSFAEFWDMLAAWSQQTFGDDAERGPRGPLLHLRKEVDEALEKPTDIMEFADLQFLVFDAARRAGFTFEQLRVAVNQKLKVNQSRLWNRPTTDEPVEHVRTGE